ncbi:hypothetical protein EON67_11175 [archaeon]|nr:MAG: hypothetical protein EON67_11175 [archaeon]
MRTFPELPLVQWAFGGEGNGMWPSLHAVHAMLRERACAVSCGAALSTRSMALPTLVGSRTHLIPSRLQEL